jgi:hypothetical protein
LERIGVYPIHSVEIPNVGEKDCCAYYVRQREPKTFQNIADDFQATSGLGRYITVDDLACYWVARDLTSEEDEIPSHNGVRVGAVRDRDARVREGIVFHVVLGIWDAFFNSLQVLRRF